MPKNCKTSLGNWQLGIELIGCKLLTHHQSHSAHLRGNFYWLFHVGPQCSDVQMSCHYLTVTGYYSYHRYYYRDLYIVVMHLVLSCGSYIVVVYFGKQLPIEIVRLF